MEIFCAIFEINSFCETPWINHNEIRKFSYLFLSVGQNLYDFFLELPDIAPLTVGIWCGESKPLINEYIKPLVSELKTILSNGIQVNSHQITVKIGRIICDTPARALLKGMLLRLMHFK